MNCAVETELQQPVDLRKAASVFFQSNSIYKNTQQLVKNEICVSHTAPEVVNSS